MGVLENRVRIPSIQAYCTTYGHGTVIDPEVLHCGGTRIDTCIIPLDVNRTIFDVCSTSSMYSPGTTTCEGHITVLECDGFGTFLGISRFVHKIDTIFPTIDVQLKLLGSGYPTYVCRFILSDLHTSASTIDVEDPTTHDRQRDSVDSALSRCNVVHTIDDYIQMLGHRGFDTSLFGIDVKIIQCECVCGDVERCSTAVTIAYDVFIIGDLYSADPQIIRHLGYDVSECSGFTSVLDCCFELP